jgi:hypothetical protein
MVEKNTKSALLIWLFLVLMTGIINSVIWVIVAYIIHRNVPTGHYLHNPDPWFFPALLMTWIVLLLIARFWARKDFRLEAE